MNDVDSAGNCTMVTDGASIPGGEGPSMVRRRYSWPALTNWWRGLFTLSLGLTLCAIAVAESTGDAEAPTWFLAFAIPVLTEWIGEWVLLSRKQEA